MCIPCETFSEHRLNILSELLHSIIPSINSYVNIRSFQNVQEPLYLIQYTFCLLLQLRENNLGLPPFCFQLQLKTTRVECPIIPSENFFRISLPWIVRFYWWLCFLLEIMQEGSVCFEVTLINNGWFSVKAIVVWVGLSAFYSLHNFIFSMAPIQTPQIALVLMLLINGQCV